MSRGRPPYADILTPAEWHVLEHLREGLTNADIAVRLGISPDGVKYHISNMLAKLDLPDRHALAEWEPPRSEGRARPLQVLLVGVGGLFCAAATGFGILVAVGATGGGATGGNNHVPGQVVIAGETYVEIGQVRGQSSVSNRPGLIVLQAPAGGMLTIRLEDRLQDGGWTVLGSSNGVVDYDHLLHDPLVPIHLTVAWGDQDTRLEGDFRNGVVQAVAQSATAGPAVVIAISAGDGTTQQAAVESDGHLYVAASPIAADAVINQTTGERLDVSAAQAFGHILPAGRGAGWTWCGESPCVANVSGAFVAPADGRVSCRADGKFQFDGGNVELRFEQSTSGGGALPCSASQDRGSASALPEGRYQITAFGADGKPLPVAASFDGAIYVGNITPTIGCPCISGN